MARAKKERTAVRLTSPTGARVTVPADSEAKYIARGYKPAATKKSGGAAKPAATKKGSDEAKPAADEK